MPWTRAKHLEQWAGDQLASRNLPLLVRKLVRKTVPSLSKLNIPTNEQVNRPGFDGIVECATGNQYVPAGKSVWEMGVDQDPKSKAVKDFKKRSEELSEAEKAETTFVFVTPRPFLKKDEWATAKRTAGGWKDVVVLDNNDLEQWLDLARDVDAWISDQTKQIPSGVRSLASHWNALREIADNPLVPQVFTASRETEVQSIVEFLNRHADSLFLRTPGLDDGIDFIAALAAEKSEEFTQGEPVVEIHSLQLLENAVIVSELNEWRQLAHSDGPLFLIASPEMELSSTDISAAIQAGHYVLVSGPRGIVPAERGITLRGIRQYELKNALEESGYPDAQASSHSLASAGNTSVLKRRISKHPEQKLPEWASSKHIGEVEAFALIGGWCHVDPTPPKQENVPEPFRYQPPIDLDVVLEIAGINKQQLEAALARWRVWPEPLFLKFGDNVFVASREDAWYLVGDKVTDSQLERFADRAIFVLEEDSPALELETEKRWMASIYGKRRSISEALRKSLAETLALMAACPTEEHAESDARFKATVQRVINAVLPKESGWQRWASLGRNIQIIAEADPELFLSRIEEDLNSQSPAIPQLFLEQTGSPFAGWLHCDLLWALETLAWSPDYLSRVSVILAKLVPLIPPRGNHGNRPEGSLCEIFLMWLPHTNANIEDRIAALRKVLKVEPNVGWRLLLDLLPDGHSVSHNTSMPRWRPWADGWSREAAQKDRYKYAMAMVDVCLEQLDHDPAKWAEALERMLRFNPEVSQRVIGQLRETAESFKANPDEAFKLWDALRSITDKHKKFEDAKWAFKKEIIADLAKVQEDIVPSDLIKKHLWLFEPHAELPGFKKYKQYDEHERALNESRRDAIQQINNQLGVDGVWKLLEHGADANTVGFISGKYGIFTEKEFDIAKSLVESDKTRLVFASSFAIASYYDRGQWDWVNSLDMSQWTDEEIGKFSLCLPFDTSVWDWVAAQREVVQAEYWSRKRALLREKDISVIRRAVEGLLAARRPFSAIDMLNFHRDVELPSELIAEALEAGISIESAEEMGDVGYDIQQLIGKLQADKSYDRKHLARLEWGYLRFLERSYSNTGPDTLEEAVKENPGFYVELIQYAFRGKDVSPEELPDDEQVRFRAGRAIEFLENLDLLPGQDKKGVVDPKCLESWIKEVFKLSKPSGHDEIAAHKIGQYIGRSIYPYLDDTDILSQIATVVESVGNDDLNDGITNGLYNSRGVSSRGPFDGGGQERELAEKFSKRARTVRDISPKLANVFTSMQKSYEHDAQRWDLEAEQLRFGR
jgi:hypothetical protein